jgi:peptidoglycan/LPS O-acetylase OafA/YrhL
MMTVKSREHLYQPTVTADDDVRNFDQPWDPGHLTILTFFTGLLGGGVLLALNFRRLGQPQRGPWSMVAVIVLGIALVVASVIAMDAGQSSSLVRIGGRAVAVAIALVLARLQKHRWEIFDPGIEEQRRLLWPAIGSFVAAMVASAIIVAITNALMG